MVGSIELLFDDRTDAALRRCWQVLTDADLPSQGRLSAPTNRPHVTLAVADEIAADVDGPLHRLADRLPLPCVLGAPVLFGSGRITLARLIVASAELLDLHREVHQVCLPYLIGGPAPHTEPGAWTAHSTMARRLTATQLTAACELPGLTRELSGRFTGLRRWDGHGRVEHVLVS